MDKTFTFKFNINLQRFSMINIAIQLWSSKEIRKKTDEYFSKKEMSSNWHSIAQQVIRNLHLLNLPKRLHGQLEDIVIFIGEKLRNWNNWLVRRLGLDISFAKKIYWTDRGTIDESKIFQLYWQTDDNIRNMKKTDKLPSPPLYYLAAIFGQEDFVEKHKTEILKETNKSLHPKLEIGEDEHVVYIMYIWCILCLDRTVKWFSRDTDVIEAISTIPHYARTMFRMVRTLVTFSYCGYSKFIINFYNGMVYDSTPSGWACLSQFSNDLTYAFGYNQCNVTYNYEREKLLETLLFLAPLADFRRFLQGNHTVFLKNIFLTWPYQEFFMDLFDCTSRSESQYETFMFFIRCHIKSKKNNEQVADFSRKNVYNVLLKYIENPPSPDKLMEEFLSSQ